MNVFHGTRWIWLGLMVAAVVLLAGNRPAQADPFTGDVCFTVHVLQSEAGAEDTRYVMRAHSTALDEHMSSIYGYALNAGDNPTVVAGIANQVGTGSIYVNLDWTYNQKSPQKIKTGVMQMKLNPTTLSGTFTLVATKFDPATGLFKQGFDSGTVAPRSCP